MKRYKLRKTGYGAVQNLFWQIRETRKVPKYRLFRIFPLFENHQSEVLNGTLYIGFGKGSAMTMLRWLVFCCALILLVAVGGCYKSPHADIFEAVAKGTVRDVQHFFSRGADVNTTRRISLNGEPYDKPLIFIANYSNTDVIKYLIDRGTDVNVKEPLALGGNTPLHIAAGGGSSLELVKYLIENGADVNAKNAYGVSALHLAVRHREIDVLKHLIAHGADVNAHSERFGTPVHFVSRWRVEIEKLEYLIKNGADVNMRNGRGLTPLDILAMSDNEPSPDGALVIATESEKAVWADRVPELKAILRAAGGKRGEEL